MGMCNTRTRVQDQDGGGEKDSIQLMPGPNPAWFSCVPLVSRILFDCCDGLVVC